MIIQRVGPLVNFNSPWCSNALSILKKMWNKLYEDRKNKYK